MCTGMCLYVKSSGTELWMVRSHKNKLGPQQEQVLLSAEPTLQPLHSSFKPVYYAEIDVLNFLTVIKSYTHMQLYKLQDPKTKVEANPIINPAPHTYTDMSILPLT